MNVAQLIEMLRAVEDQTATVVIPCYDKEWEFEEATSVGPEMDTEFLGDDEAVGEDGNPPHRIVVTIE